MSFFSEGSCDKSDGGGSCGGFTTVVRDCTLQAVHNSRLTFAVTVGVVVRVIHSNSNCVRQLGVACGYYCCNNNLAGRLVVVAKIRRSYGYSVLYTGTRFGNSSGGSKDSGGVSCDNSGGGDSNGDFT